MKAKMKVLYNGGELDFREPGSFNVLLVKWVSKRRVDYVLESTLVTDEKETETSILFSIGVFFKSITKESLVEAVDDFEAINKAAEEYHINTELSAKYKR